MATPIKRIEKEFLLKVLYDEQLPVIYHWNRSEYILKLERPAKKEVIFKADRPITGMRIGKRMDLMFDYRGQVITFTVEISSLAEGRIIAETPEFLYKNLDRSYFRVTLPPDLQVQFTFLGDRYSLSFPKISEYESVEDVGEFLRHTDPKNLSALIKQMASWIKIYANGFRLFIFRETKPSATEERIIAETGKAFYIPSTLAGLPKEDPYPKKRIITEDIFKRYLESAGVALANVDETYTRFIREKFEGSIFSDAWVPILFQEYVIGYIHVWINREGKAPFAHEVIETLFQFAKILAFSLKANGYFDTGLLKNDPFEGNVIDISASGLLFAYPHSTTSSALLPEGELSVKLIAPKRTINTTAKIVRRYKDSSMDYFGCHFSDIHPEDMRFLFEFIYGKPITDADILFFAGQV
ncbi:MAG: PilZ domain-containing protein [Treponema sp.]|jgi:hypothetical protein|nr:PilZ domain-containing protein [Treponema sp.]